MSGGIKLFKNVCIYPSNAVGKVSFISLSFSTASSTARINLSNDALNNAPNSLDFGTLINVSAYPPLFGPSTFGMR